jgi:Uma2 family endonuclease
MSVALTERRMTREEFFDWAQARDERYEFDGFQPVAMTGGSVNHSTITINILAGLLQRLRGRPCRPLGPDAGVATVGDKVRYPDALITCTRTPGEDRLALNPVVVFEVLSPDSGRTDRIDKVREYGATPTILRYVIVERTSIGLTVLSRADGAQPWTAAALADGDVLAIPEVGVEIPVAEFYDNVDLPSADAPGSD